VSIPFIDLQAQRRRLGKRIDDAILKVVNHAAYILGPKVQELEGRFGRRGGHGLKARWQGWRRLRTIKRHGIGGRCWD
jgi:hypothetical protein